MMNPDTNEFEEVFKDTKEVAGEIQKLQDQHLAQFLDKDGNHVPNEKVFNVGEELTIKGYVFRIKNIRRKRLDLEPVRPDTIPLTK